MGGEDTSGTPIRLLKSAASSITSGRVSRRDVNGRNPLYGSTGQIGATNLVEFSGPSILVARVGANAGSVYRVDGQYGVSDNTLVIRPAANQDVDFLTEVLRHANLNRMVYGSGQPLVTGTMLKSLEIPDLPLVSQRRIAVALGDVDALLATLGRLIAKKQAVKQGLAQQLLTGSTRLPGFSGTWGEASLGEISAPITKGATPTTYGFAWESSGIPFLRSECVSECGLDMRRSMFISPAAHHALRRSRVAGGDILVTITGYVGRVARLVNISEANINQHIARVRIKDDRFDSGYIYHYLSQRSMREYYESIVTGQAYPQISLAQVRDTKIPVIPFDEQQAIAAALDDADGEMDLLRQRLAKAQRVKKGVMQELLTGRTRLPVRGEGSE
ncbi:restriction endonuclease subunit S [Streptomyces globisporus]|uniref:restriction endonuclease subunit S n=1 Tax=Streptomyces globisporus TaxID=1908 RepID=UPI003CEB0F56